MPLAVTVPATSDQHPGFGLFAVLFIPLCYLSPSCSLTAAPSSPAVAVRRHVRHKGLAGWAGRGGPHTDGDDRPGRGQPAAATLQLQQLGPAPRRPLRRLWRPRAGGGARRRERQDAVLLARPRQARRPRHLGVGAGGRGALGGPGAVAERDRRHRHAWRRRSQLSAPPFLVCKGAENCCFDGDGIGVDAVPPLRSIPEIGAAAGGWSYVDGLSLSVRGQGFAPRSRPQGAPYARMPRPPRPPSEDRFGGFRGGADRVRERCRHAVRVARLPPTKPVPCVPQHRSRRLNPPTPLLLLPPPPLHAYMGRSRGLHHVARSFVLIGYGTVLSGPNWGVRYERARPLRPGRARRRHLAVCGHVGECD